MDSRLAADPTVRRILDTLATLENAAGVRAHYRILDPPPVEATDLSSLQTLARVLGDWIGLRNAMFIITLIEGDATPTIYRIDPDQEEFAMELPSKALNSPETTLAAVTRQVARAYLVNSNIAASSIDPSRSSGSLADITAIFLGMGKLIMNGAENPPSRMPSASLQPSDSDPLSPDFLAFTHRVVCAMRGLDWAQNVSGLNSTAIANLRQWDSFRDSVFSQSLRNVLTASASHRPLMDAIEDNHLALSRFDQLQRTFTATVIEPLQKEMETYHATCREGTERLGTREQETYDPCLVYLNQLRRRMDLQRFADQLQTQQDLIIRRLKVLTAGMSDLAARDLVNAENAADNLRFAHCPFDGTPISIHGENHDVRVKCPKCGYAFLATPGVPTIPALQNIQQNAGSGTTVTGEDNFSNASDGQNSTKSKGTANPPSANNSTPNTTKTKSKGALWLGLGLALLPLSWLPMISYVLVKTTQGQQAPLTDPLGKFGMAGSALGLAIMLIGFVLILTRLAKKK